MPRLGFKPGQWWETANGQWQCLRPLGHKDRPCMFMPCRSRSKQVFTIFMLDGHITGTVHGVLRGRINLRMRIAANHFICCVIVYQWLSTYEMTTTQMIRRSRCYLNRYLFMCYFHSWRSFTLSQPLFVKNMF